MELKIKHYISMSMGLIIIFIDFLLFFSFKGEIGPKEWYFSPIIVLGTLIGAITFILDFMEENNRQKELEANFLEFVRGLVETVRSGASIPQAIMQISNVNYGSLTPYIKKLA